MMERFYRGLLLLYPPAHRREYGAEMVETFARRADTARRSGPVARARFVGREAFGAVRIAVRERLGSPDTGGPSANSPTVSRVSARRPPGRRGTTLGADLRHALRRLRSSPGFTIATVLTLALGIGGNTAIFTVVNAVVVSPLPYPDSDRLITVAADVEAVDAHGIEIPIGFWLGFRRLNESFDEIGLFEYSTANLSGEGPPERVAAIEATGSLFDTLGVPPAMGRPIMQDDEAPGAPLVVLLSHGLWTRRYGADPSMIGRTIRVDSVAAEVVGIMPEGFAFPRPETQIWGPLTIDRTTDPPISFSYSSVGRLSEGVTLDRAHQDLARVTDQLPEMFGNITVDFIDSYGVSPSLRSLKAQVVGTIADTLWVLLGAVGFVLLIACANVANLFLVRTQARHREVGLRSALGASRADLARYFLSESLIIGGLAGAVGVGLAVAGVRLLVAFGPDDLPRLQEVSIGAAELGFAAAISLLVAVAFGSLPILRLSRQQLVDQLKEGSDRATVTSGSRRATSLLVVAQVSLALLLMVGAALFAQSLRNLIRIDPGFRAEGVLTFRLTLSDAAYPDDSRRALFHQELLDRLEALPGVEAAGLTRCLPLQGWCGGNPVASLDSPLPPEAFRDVASIKPVSPGYFRALGIPLQAGRDIERNDYEQRTGAAVVSEALAERLFPGLDPLGKRVYPSEGGPDDEADWYTVVGVAGTIKRLELDEEPADILYVAMLGTDDQFLPNLDQVTVAVRTQGDPLELAGAVRDTVWAIESEMPVAAIETMASVLARASARVAFTAVLIGIAAVVALVLGAVGIYGVVSHTVGRRTSEIGVRMALGARQGEVLRMVLRQGVTVVLIGIAIGVAGAFALARVVEALLYEVSAGDPFTLVAVSTALLAVALLASFLPARRAARVDPAISLRG